MSALADDIDRLFTSKCSTKTVQSNDNGFFMNFYQTVVSSFKNDDDFRVWLRDGFGKCESDSERLQFLYKDPIVSWEILGTLEHVTEVFRKKDSLFSWQKRDQVVKLLKMHDDGNRQIPLEKILILASQAVMRAPSKDADLHIDNGLTLALALATRSEVFLRLNDGANGLSDLQLAVKNGLDVKKNADYYSKLAKFYALLNEDKKSEIAINLYHQLTGLDGFRRDILINEVHALKASSKQKSSTSSQPTPPSLKEHPNESKSNIERCTSASLNLTSSKDAGKFFVAASTIEAGDTLLAEPPRCASLYPKNFGTHCYHCLTRLTAPLGCDACSSVAFCSLACRNAACGSYHRFECRFLDLLIGSGASILCHIALRMVAMHASAEKALEASAEGLCTNASQRSEEDFFRRSLMAAFLLRVLQKSEFFGRRMSESAEPTAIELKIGALLLAHLQSLQFNAHEIYETLTKDHAFAGSRINYIGVGIYEAGALFNHACYPSVMRYFCGATLVLKAIRPHASGELVAENYGPNFTRQTRGERQRALASRYWFKCSCVACGENWPVLERLTNRCKLRCTTDGCNGSFNYQSEREKNAKCAKCKQNVSLQLSLGVLREAEEKFKLGAEAMDVEKVDEAINAFKSGIELFHKVALPPHKDLHIAQESLRACIATGGNTFNAAS